MNRIAAALLMVPLSMSAGCARHVATTFKDLQTSVRTGTTIAVKERNGKEAKGRLESVTGSSLRLRLRDAAALDFAENDVARITVSDTLWNGLLIGAAVGGGSFAAIGEEGCTSPEAVPGCRRVSRGAGIATMAAIGAGIGVGFDALHRRRVFLGPAAHRARVSIRPEFGRRRTAIVLTSRF